MYKVALLPLLQCLPCVAYFDIHDAYFYLYLHAAVGCPVITCEAWALSVQTSIDSNR